MRSSPSRSAVPGANLAMVSRNADDDCVSAIALIIEKLPAEVDVTSVGSDACAGLIPV
ncbi:hypothetical protein GCM10020255_049890 [Rhodococcus baikonurensis]